MSASRSSTTVRWPVPCNALVMAVPIAPAPPVITAIRPCRGSSAVVMACSWVNVHAVAEVEADRLQDREGGGDGKHVDGAQHAGVLLDDGRGGGVGHRVQQALDGGPEVVAVLLE